MPQYPWKRFWFRLDAPPSLDDNGFLIDPELESWLRPYSRAISCEDFDHKPCLVLLGEPGIGKSTELREIQDRIPQEERQIYIRLIDIRPEGELRSELFESSVWQEWLSGTGRLFLLIDSLDEGQIQLKTVGKQLCKGLRKNQQHLERLRLRITCRSAEWPLALTEELEGLFRKEAVLLAQLAPLRWKDMLSALEIEQINPSHFQAELTRVDAKVFASVPLTLQFLLGIFKKEEKLPFGRTDLYDKGCLHLCREENIDRRSSKVFGNLSPEKKREIASRISAATVFTGRPTVWLGRQRSTGPSNILNMEDLAVPVDLEQETELALTENDYREVIETPLFSHTVEDSFQFVHRSHQEFLAARYIAKSKLELPCLISLFRNPQLSDMRVPPQLAETAGWMATYSSEFRNHLLTYDPFTLLRSDVALNSEGVRKQLVTRLIRGMQDGTLDTQEWELRRFYKRLDHPEIALQLRSILSDGQSNFETRAFAIHMAHACQCNALANDLIDIVLNPNESVVIREESTRALAELADSNQRIRLKFHVLDTDFNDPRDTIRGYVLSALWQNNELSSEELFNALTNPKAPNSGSSYSSFLQIDLPKTLRSDCLPSALRWCQRSDFAFEPISRFDELIDKIAELAWGAARNPDVQAELAKAILKIISRVGRPRNCWAVNPTTVSTEDRRAILELMNTHADQSHQEVYTFTYASLGLVCSLDLEWLLERAADAETPSLAQRFAKLAEFVFRPARDTDLRIIQI